MIKKLSLISLFTLLPASFYYAQTTVYAYVQDQEGKAIENAEIDLSESTNDQVADKIGYFQFVDLMPGNYSITVSRPNFDARIIEFSVTEGEKRKDLGIINLVRTSVEAGIVVIDDSAADTEDGGSSMQPTLGLLSSGRDAFANIAAFELGAYWFRPRGVENRYEDVLFNGVSMSKNDDGKIEFSNWGGLNDITRYPYEFVDNINPSEFTFGNLGGVAYYNTRASSFRNQTSLAYSFTNRSYFHRVMATYGSGLTKNGWAFTVSASRRWADRGIIDGTYQDSYAYFVAIEKQFSDRHAINLTAFGAPTYRASNSPNTQEVYDLMGKNYNAYWGWQDGEKRNSRIRRMFEPVFQLTDYLKLGKTSNWNNTISYQFGRDGRSRLDWFHGADPNPTYYRKLPSFWFDTYMMPNSEGGEVITDNEQAQYDALINSWQNDQNVSQINWNQLYLANQLNKNSNGVDRGAIYSIVEDVNEDKTFNFVSHFDTQLQPNWKLNLNFAYQNLRSDNFRAVKDLLGANFAWNLNAFGGDQPYNVDGPIQVKEGDRTQYSYELHRDSYNLHAGTEVDLDKWNFVASIFGAYSESQRIGDYRHHIYLNDSYGESDIYKAFDAGVKGRATYRIDGRNFLVYNGTFFTLAPTLNEIFVNPRANNFRTPQLRNQVINSNELSFISRGQILKLRLSGYYTTMNNGTDVARYYAEQSDGGANDLFVTEILAGIDKRYMGIEAGVDWKITPTINALAAAAIGDYTITNNPNVFYTADEVNRQQGFENMGPANLKGYKVAGTPQKAFTFQLKYNSPKYWWVGASANYLMDSYLDFSALNRTRNFYTNPDTGDNYYYNGTMVTQDMVNTLLQQRKFDDQFMLNANAGKSFLIGGYRLGISLSVNNILNNRNYITGGFEQGRKSNYIEALQDSERETPFFGPKLWYDRGTTFFANVYLRF